MIKTFYWHDQKVYNEKGKQIDTCTWAEAQRIASACHALAPALGIDSVRVLKMEPPR